MKIIWLDDDEKSLSYGKELFKKYGIEVIPCTTVSSALKYINEGVSNYLLLDIHFPQNPKEGIVFLEQIRKLGKKTKVVIFTGYAEMEDSVKLVRDYDAIDYIEKPIPLDPIKQKAFFEKLKRTFKKRSSVKAKKKKPNKKPTAFIVHGHDDKSKLDLKNYLQNTLSFKEPTILHEKPNMGKTIIEKFEKHTKNVDFVFVLLTPDDVVINPNVTNDLKRRARQNVILEMGYFLGKLGRKSGKIILLYKGELELPSDISGIIYIDISNGIEASGEKIRAEIKKKYKGQKP